MRDVSPPRVLRWPPCLLQRRFYASQFSVGRASVEEKAVLWWIPLTLKAENSGAATGVAAAATAAAASGGFSTATWGTTFDYDAGRDGYIKANLNQTGYYRVNYPSVVWQKLGAAIQTQVGFRVPAAPVVACGTRTAVPRTQGVCLPTADVLVRLVAADDWVWWPDRQRSIRLGGGLVCHDVRPVPA